MTTLAQRQKDNKPAVLAGFILLSAIAAFFALVTYRGALFSTAATVKPIPEIKYQPHAVEKHGSDALAIKTNSICLKLGGTWLHASGEPQTGRSRCQGGDPSLEDDTLLGVDLCETATALLRCAKAVKRSFCCKSGSPQMPTSKTCQ